MSNSQPGNNTEKKRQEINRKYEIQETSKQIDDEKKKERRNFKWEDNERIKDRIKESRAM